MLYQVRYGDSPTTIAREFGVSRDALIAANPQKPTAIVNGQLTWREIFPRETINVPIGGIVGDSALDAINALMSAAGGPCAQANLPLVCAAQKALGVVVDGKWGNDTSTAARRSFPGAPPGCSPRPAWWKPAGQSNCAGIVIPTPTAAIPPSIQIPAPITSLVPQAIQALATINPCDPSSVAVVCAAQKALGVVVDGKYGNDTATAARRVLPAAPAGCSPRPSWWTPAGQSNCTIAVAPLPTPVTPPPVQPPPVQVTPVSNIPTAVLALRSINPCDQSNVNLVRQAQSALGQEVDGKYGNNTAVAARRLVPDAPAACSPAPLWWGKKGSTPGATPGTTPVDTSAADAAAAKASADAAAAKAAADIAAKAAADAVTQAQADQAAAAAKAASDAAAAAAAKAAAIAGNEAAAAKAAADAAAAKIASDAASKSAGSGSQQITPPEKKEGISTGAIVAGAVGVAAIAGLIALAASSKKGTRGAHGARGKRGPSGKKRKSSGPKRKSSRKKRK